MDPMGHDNYYFCIIIVILVLTLIVLCIYIMTIREMINQSDIVISIS